MSNTRITKRDATGMPIVITTPEGQELRLSQPYDEGWRSILARLDMLWRYEHGHDLQWAGVGAMRKRP